MERQLAYVTNGVRRPSLQRKEAAANAQLAGALLVQSEGGGRAASWAEAKVVSSEAEMRAQARRAIVGAVAARMQRDRVNKVHAASIDPRGLRESIDPRGQNSPNHRVARLPFESRGRPRRDGEAPSASSILPERTTHADDSPPAGSWL